MARAPRVKSGYKDRPCPATPDGRHAWTTMEGKDINGDYMKMGSICRHCGNRP